jgi:hypothetical protein
MRPRRRARRERAQAARALHRRAALARARVGWNSTLHAHRPQQTAPATFIPFFPSASPPLLL